jgi:hypothetical protein
LKLKDEFGQPAESKSHNTEKKFSSSREIKFELLKEKMNLEQQMHKQFDDLCKVQNKREEVIQKKTD